MADREADRPPAAGAAYGPAGELRRVILGLVPSSWTEAELADDLSLGPGGLGLDSVAVVELLVACEARWNVPFPASLLEAPLTVGALVTHLKDAGVE